MSPLLIGGLVAIGVLILISIGFISHSLERARLERARQTAELNAKVKHCGAVAAQLPGQFMSVELKMLLLTIERHFLTELTRLDRKNERAARQLEQVNDQLSLGEAAVDNPPVAVSNEAQAKEIRNLLENLHKLISQAHQDGLLDKSAMQHWSVIIRQHLMTITLDMFQSVARQALQQGKPRVAKLQYERAIAYLQKQNNPAYADRVAQFKQLHAEAEQAAIRAEQANAGDSSELGAGLQALEADDEAWKKKAVYDD
ncbi:hypothetical protein KEM63_09975 [Halopseudomonas nanhaiensis]|uniref:hypothetical protein n=1 Tax=Halopseudomonas nanhaiensis TaxID=2830842 RepID=UPI001CBCEDA3|nr:hypothetical protein [Halopseudomonas nanhaiensis]UAW97159.1 hypothetical protein KEM63_09975 [Halopseudomonas nanhaiensis]